MKKAVSLDFKNIIFGKEGYVASVTINRPEKLNAINWDTLQEIGEAFKLITNDSQIRVVVVSGKGEKVFCAGARAFSQI